MFPVTHSTCERCAVLSQHFLKCFLGPRSFGPAILVVLRVLIPLLGGCQSYISLLEFLYMLSLGLHQCTRAMEVQVWWGLGYLIALLTCAKPKLHNVPNMHGSHSLYIGTGHTSADAQRGCAARMQGAMALQIYI